MVAPSPVGVIEMDKEVPEMIWRKMDHTDLKKGGRKERKEERK